MLIFRAEDWSLSDYDVTDSWTELQAMLDYQADSKSLETSRSND